MNIKKTILTAVAILAVIAVCQARLTVTSESEKGAFPEETRKRYVADIS